jgi:hypothetical protein
MQFSIAASTTACSQIDGTTTGEKLVPLGRQTAGFRFMIGISSLADADRYQLRSASLQTTNAKTFVAADSASMKAATALLKPDTTTGTWPVPYKRLVTSKAGRHAYPGTMVVYASVPTSGLPAGDAKDYARLLSFVASKGQTPGQGVGELPPGYLPITAANGLGDLAGYTLAASKAVAAQKGILPSLTGNPAPGGGRNHSTPTPTRSSTSTSSAMTPTGTHVANPQVAQSSSSVADPTPTVASSPATNTASLGRTLGINLGGGGLAVVVVIALAMLAGIGTPATYFVGRKLGRW